MMPLMVEACPSFRPEWDEFVDEWKSEGDLPLYLALSSLARHLIAILAAGDNASVSRAFAVVERWYIEGDAYVREAATVGLLEDLQDEHLHTTPQQFEPFLLPQSRKFWRRVDRYYSHGKSISYD